MRKFLTYLVWTLVGVFLVFDIVFAIGMRLPVDHVQTRKMTLQQPIQQVWNTITDYEAQPIWRTNLKSVQRLPEQNGMPVWRENYKHGPSQTLITEQSVPPSLLVRTLTDQNAPEEGTWEMRLQPAGNGTTIEITERGRIRSPLIRFLSAEVFHYNWIDDYMKMLAAKFHEKAAIS